MLANLRFETLTEHIDLLRFGIDVLGADILVTLCKLRYWRHACSSWAAYRLIISIEIELRWYQHFVYYHKACKHSLLFYPFRTHIARQNLGSNSALPNAQQLDGFCSRFPNQLKLISNYLLPSRRSNCDSRIANVLRKYYSRPYFLPADSLLTKTDWLFMGSPGYGAHLHVSIRSQFGMPKNVKSYCNAVLHQAID